MASRWSNLRMAMGDSAGCRGLVARGGDRLCDGRGVKRRGPRRTLACDPLKPVDCCVISDLSFMRLAKWGAMRRNDVRMPRDEGRQVDQQGSGNGQGIEGLVARLGGDFAACKPVVTILYAHKRQGEDLLSGAKRSYVQGSDFLC